MAATECRGVAEIINRIPVVHVHGSTGKLEWQGPVQGTPVRFGEKVTSSSLDVGYSLFVIGYSKKTQNTARDKNE